MENTNAHHRPKGLPRWTLWAATPVVLALGFVAGMAVATYQPDQTPPEAPHTEVQLPPTTAQTAPSATQPAPAQTDAAWRIVTSNQGKTVGSLPGLPGESPLETGGHSTPTSPAQPFTGTPTNSEDAKKALAADFSLFSHGGAVFRAEYQKMTHSGTAASVVGMISAADYPNWEKAVREYPEPLRQWLESAAHRVQDAAAREGFYVAWAVVDVLDARPADFADNELTPMENGTYLVIRRLASTADHTKSEISLRPLTSLLDSRANRRVTSADPWSTYGPVIRFDGDDIYRPSRLSGTRPRK